MRSNSSRGCVLRRRCLAGTKPGTIAPLMPSGAGAVSGKFSAAIVFFLREAIDQIVSVSTSRARSEEHTSELQSLMRISYAVFCLKKKKTKTTSTLTTIPNLTIHPRKHNQHTLLTKTLYHYTHTH